MVPFCTTYMIEIVCSAEETVFRGLGGVVSAVAPLFREERNSIVASEKVMSHFHHVQIIMSDPFATKEKIVLLAFVKKYWPSYLQAGGRWGRLNAIHARNAEGHAFNPKKLHVLLFLSQSHVPEKSKGRFSIDVSFFYIKIVLLKFPESHFKLIGRWIVFSVVELHRPSFCCSWWALWTVLLKTYCSVFSKKLWQEFVEMSKNLCQKCVLFIRLKYPGFKYQNLDFAKTTLKSVRCATSLVGNLARLCYEE